MACDAQDLYGRFTLDAASEFLFGKNMDTLSASLPVPGETAMGPKGSAAEDSWGSFAQAFDMAQVNITNRGRIGSMWPLFELFKDKNEEHCTVVKQWLDPLVEQVLENKRIMKKAGISSSIAEKNFLQHLTDSTDGQFLFLGKNYSPYSHNLDPVLIRDQLLSILLASRDTVCFIQWSTISKLISHRPLAL